MYSGTTDLSGLILETIHAERGCGHTTETLLVRLASAGVPWCADHIRARVAALIADGRLDMRSDGKLIAEMGPIEPEVGLYKGRWYAVTPGGVSGPFLYMTEAIRVFKRSIHSAIPGSMAGTTH